MTSVQKASGCDATAQSGKKPPGRPKGSRNRRTLALEALFAGEATEIARKAIELAKNGDPTSIKMILDRVAPVRKGAAVDLPDFPRIQSIADVPSAHAFLLTAMTVGRLTPDEGAAIALAVDKYVSAVEAVDMETRLRALEARCAKD